MSVFLHALLLFGFERPEPIRPAVLPSAIDLVIRTRPAAVAAPVFPALPALDAPRRTPAARTRMAQGRDGLTDSPMHVAQPGPLPVEVSPGVERAQSAAGAEVSGEVPTKPRSEGVDADGLRQYRIDLASATRRFRAYPALARARGWEGTVELAVTAGTLTPAPIVRVHRSSGYAALDEQAVLMLTQAVRIAPLPESLRGREINIVLPVSFKLDD